jgi:hypothetical protein
MFLSSFFYRYMVIIDDIWHWEEWQVIRKALAKNNLDCKLIMTTRLESIAEKCDKQRDTVVYRPEYCLEDLERLSARILSKYVEVANKNWVSTKIAEICCRKTVYCCPLAVICLSSGLAQIHHMELELDIWASHILGDGFLSTPSLQPLVQSLSLGFDDLPVQLRTCLLYCTLYPPGYTIDRGCLVRKWVAEGFASQVEIAYSYIDKLVSRNLLLRKLFLCVHPMMQDFLICKAKEDNFLAYNVDAIRQIRRLSLTSTDSNLDEDVVSQTRSLVVSGNKCKLDGVPFKAFKKLRVLVISGIARTHMQNGHLVHICGLIWLRSLVLNGCRQITELPREIGRLQKLETLSVAGTHISKLPTEIGKLKHLETLDISSTEVVELPTCIEKLQSLKTLNISGTKVSELPMEIRKLKHLRTLDMRCTKVRVLPWEVQNSINVHVGDLDSVKMVQWAGAVSPDRVISSSSRENYRRALSIMFFDPLDEMCEEPLQVPLLRVSGRYMKVPQWVKQDLCNVCSLDIRLFKLGEDDLEFLKRQMPNLQALKLRLEVLPREPVAITGGGFSKLETFYVDCRLPRVITFKEGAMPKLKRLEFKFYTGTARQDYSMGVMHLPSLESIEFRCSENYKSDSQGISATIEAMRKEATEHPNCIFLYFTDRQPEVFRSGAKWISQADRAIIQKESEERERMKKQREHLYNAAKTRAEPIKNRTGKLDFSRLD